MLLLTQTQVMQKNPNYETSYKDFRLSTVIFKLNTTHFSIRIGDRSSNCVAGLRVPHLHPLRYSLLFPNWTLRFSNTPLPSYPTEQTWVRKLKCSLARDIPLISVDRKKKKNRQKEISPVFQVILFNKLT